ncbi:MAG: hypothetical protein ABI454_13350 [Sphingomicrobium sp.]
MNGTRTRMNWTARLLIGLVLILAGAAAAVWALAHYQPAARFLGIAPAASAPLAPKPLALATVPAAQLPARQPSASEETRIAQLEGRLSRVENATQRAEGFAGRADALVVAFAARRAIDRGVALGYLENLLVDRFGAQHQPAVGTIIAASHQPVRLNDLIAQYETLGPDLRRGGAQDSWWTNFRRGLGSLIEVRRADRPSMNPDARYGRALQRLSSGDVDQALAETMRLPGAANAPDWIDKARRYIAAHRALDEIESAALLAGGNHAG